jgi:hypothetical protein
MTAIDFPFWFCAQKKAVARTADVQLLVGCAYTLLGTGSGGDSATRHDSNGTTVVIASSSSRLVSLVIGMPSAFALK